MWTMLGIANIGYSVFVGAGFVVTEVDDVGYYLFIEPPQERDVHRYSLIFALDL